MIVAEPAPTRVRQDADIGQIAVILRIIQTIADHELVRNPEAHVGHFDGALPAVRLVE